MTTAIKSKRGPGRPKGLGRVPGSGRAKGTPNRDRTATIDKIMREADPIQYLCKVARGDRLEAGDGPDAKKKTWWFPSASILIPSGSSTRLLTHFAARAFTPIV